ncbi:AAA domain-containing protein [Niallia sp. BSM11]
MMTIWCYNKKIIKKLEGNTMISTSRYIKEWQLALQQEINHLKRFSSTKIALFNGQHLQTEENYTYYFESISFVKIPIGSSVVLTWGKAKINGRILSSDGKSLILQIDKSIGDYVSEAFVSHDPWELLEQLMIRFDAIKENKTKRMRIKRLMNPSMPAKHPQDMIKNHVHDLSLRSKYNPITFVWGPPGTGKTYTLARVALQKYWKGKRILLLSQSNQAVDVLMKEITKTAQNKKRFKIGDILRYGGNAAEMDMHDEKITTSALLDEKDKALAVQKQELLDEKIKLKRDLARSFSSRDSQALLKMEEQIARVLEKIRKKELQFIKKAMVVGTTLAKAATDPAIYEDEYDLILLDEASMAYVPQTAFAASLGKRLIVCGDFKQLPPIAASRSEAVNKWLKEDIFHASGVADSVASGSLHQHLLLLNEQRRMHPSISSFTNKHIYHSLVSDHPTVSSSRKAITEKGPFPKEANILLDTSNFGYYGGFEKGTKSRINLMHMLLSLQLIVEAWKSGIRSIGYVTPYRAQSELMDAVTAELFPKQLADSSIQIATVHRFQGSEKDMIIFDSTEGYPHERPGMLLLGKDSDRLLNVAITRSKGKFIHIANCDFIKRRVGRDKAVRKLVEHQWSENLLVEQQKIGTWINSSHPYLKWQHAKNTKDIWEDMKNGKTVVAAMPDIVQVPQDWLQLLEAIAANTLCKVYGPVKSFKNKRVDSMEYDAPFPFVIVDEHIVWIGHPLQLVPGAKPPSIAVRIESKQLAAYLLKQLS